MPANTQDFLDFAQTAERVAFTVKRLEKASALGEYFALLDDANLKIAARYFSGRIFSLRDGRTTSIGSAALLNSVAAVTEIDTNEMRTRLVILGDFGDVTGEVLASRKDAPQTSGWTLQNLNEAFEELASTSGSKKKVELVIQILKRAHELEAKYIVKLLGGDLRIGLQEGAVEDAIARAASTPVAKVQWANMLLGDIGETAVLARHEKLDSAQMKLFHPLKFMLASPAADLSEVAKQMPEAFAVEDKFDGIRAQAHLQKINSEALADNELHGEVLQGCRVALFSRTLNEITHSFPDLMPSLITLLDTNDSLILDGEIVPVNLDDETGRVLPFQQLQKRLGRKALNDEILNAVPVAFIAYDILFEGGKILL